MQRANTAKLFEISRPISLAPLPWISMVLSGVELEEREVNREYFGYNHGLMSVSLSAQTTTAIPSLAPSFGFSREALR